MKRIICDICGREIGVTVDSSSVLMMEPATYDPGFYYNDDGKRDVCSECRNRVIKVAEKEIEKIKHEKNISK